MARSDPIRPAAIRVAGTLSDTGAVSGGRSRWVSTDTVGYGGAALSADPEP